MIVSEPHLPTRSLLEKTEPAICETNRQHVARVSQLPRENSLEESLSLPLILSQLYHGSPNMGRNATSQDLPSLSVKRMQ